MILNIAALILFFFKSSCFQIVSDGEDVIDMERTKRLLDTTKNQRLKDLLTKYEIIDVEVGVNFKCTHKFTGF